MRGTLQHVYYDFNGDGIADQTATDLNPITHTYSAPGQFFPVVTIETSAGTFSSPGGWNSIDPARLMINVQAPPQVQELLSVPDPIDLKTTSDGKLYVLSRSIATIFEYDVSVAPATLVRSLIGIGTSPTGLDVDSDGNVYVALNGDNQVARFNPTEGSFALDSTFGISGTIGKTDKTSGTGNGEFDAPYDVAVSPGGKGISVSDFGNNRIQQFDLTGAFATSYGEFGNGPQDLNGPKGLVFNTSSYLYIADSGNNRIVLDGSGGLVAGSAGTEGSALGQFRAPANLSIGTHGIYVADLGNNRVQSFSPPAPHAPLSVGIPNLRFAVSSGISQPAAVAVATDAASELLYVADTGNNRILKYKFLAGDPTAVWAQMQERLAAADVSGAISYFATGSKEDYRRAFLSSSMAVSLVTEIGSLTALSLTDDIAVYYFNGTVSEQVVMFPITFMREDGVWKIAEF